MTEYELPESRPQRPEDVDQAVYNAVCAGYSAGTLNRLWGVSERWVERCCQRYVDRDEVMVTVDCTAREKHAMLHRYHPRNPRANRRVCLVCHPPDVETRKRCQD